MKTNKPTPAQPTLAEHLALAKQALHELAKGAAEHMLDGEDNPSVQRISANAFTVSAKTLGATNWAPFSHDWKSQYERLAELIVAQKFGALSQVIQTGVLRERSSDSAERFSPRVVERLKSILGDLPSLNEKNEARPCLTSDEQEFPKSSTGKARPR